MPGNARDRDELADWLGEQVTPLPPPEGTFTLIKRRARRRRLRQAAITITAAATVAVAAIVVPRELQLHIMSPVTGGNVAARGPGQQPGTGVPGPQSSTAVKATSPPAATAPPSARAARVPENFQVSSVTFISDRAAWVIGQAGTPGHCSTRYCTSIARTTDAGLDWSGVPAPVTGPPDGPAGVSQIRFLNEVYGWSFGPQLWQTTDGGQSWTQISTGGQRVTDLETVGDRAFAIFANCSGSGAAFAAGCTRFTLEDTVAGSGTWAPVGPPTSNLSSGGASSASLSLTGSTGFLLAPDGTLFAGPVDGSAPWQRVAGQPLCPPGSAQSTGQPSSALFAAGTATSLVVVCTGARRTYVSSDGGTAWTKISSSAQTAAATSVAESPSGIIVLAARTGISVWQAGPGGWQRATLAEAAPEAGFGYIGMTTPTQGVALAAGASGHVIWLTTDGGQNWSPAPVG